MNDGSIYPPNTSPMLGADGLITPIWSAFFEEFAAATLGTALPAGGEMLYNGNVEPVGFFFCDGRELDRTTYSRLFNVIGTKYGAGNGTTTFNIPERRGKYIRGALTIATVQQGGANTVVIEGANLPVVDITVTDPGHNHPLTMDEASPTVTDPGHNHPLTMDEASPTVMDPGHDHDVDAVIGGAGIGTLGAGLLGATSTVTTTTEVTGITVDPFTPTGTVETDVTGITAQLQGGEIPLTIEPEYVSVPFIIKY